MKAVQTNRKFQLLIMLILVSTALFDRNVVQAVEPVNAALLLGEWKMVSFYDPDSDLIISKDNTLKNNIIFTHNRVTEINQLSSTSKPYQSVHKYQIKANCVELLLPDEKVCWQIKELSINKLVLDTPSGVYHLKK